MERIDLNFGGVQLFLPTQYLDHRGFFVETFRYHPWFDEQNIPPFIQDNHSYSSHRTLRGLHFQYPSKQWKLIRSATGIIYDVLVDLRPNSKNYSRWIGIELNGQTHQQVLIPPGFAHGFQVISKEGAHVLYKTTTYYEPSLEHTIAWCDSTINIDWPIADPILSERDQKAPTLKEWLCILEKMDE